MSQGLAQLKQLSTVYSKEDNMSAATAPFSSQARGRGGRRGGRTGGSKGITNAAAAQPDDTEETRKLRSKYAGQLSSLRELFPTWTDEDLLLAIQDAGGDVDTTAERISQGHAEQFSSVKSKKTVRKEAGANQSSTTPSSFQGAGAAGAAGAGGAALASGRGDRGGRGGARGGRGGAARGARGGTRGGNVGARSTSLAGANGAAADGSAGVAPATTSTGSTWADAVSATQAKQNGTANATSWADDAEAADNKAAASSTQAAATSAEGDAPQEQSKVASVMSKILPSSIQSKDQKKSWAQIARPAEPEKQAAQPPATQSAAPAAAAASTAPTKSIEKADISEPIHSTAVANAAPPAAAQQEPAQAATNLPSAAATGAAPAQDSTSAVPPAAAAAAAPAAGVAAVDHAGRPNNSRAPQSQRQMQRAKQDQPVVMRGNKTQYGNLDQRFGGLSFGGNDADEAEAAAPAAAAAPSAADPAIGAPQDQSRYSAVAAPATQQQPQQATQADPYAQQTGATRDAFGQAQPYGFQQPQQQQAQPQSALSQHEQAHQAAVAQAQAAHHAQHPEAGTAYQQSSLGGYSAPAAQQQSQPQQQQQPQYGDYSSMYGGLDNQRLSGYYGGYDQQSMLGRADDRSQQTQASTQQPQTGLAASNDPAGQAQQQPSGMTGQPGGLPQQQQQQQQQFPNVMPYYYPHYYMPQQYQHYGQPASGYGQYLYGGQPQQQQQQQHPSKPAQPASVQSSYGQAGPQGSDLSSTTPYGSSAGAHGNYGQSPASTLHSTYGGDYGRSNVGGVQNLGSGNSTDYSKLYGNNAGSAGSNTNAASSIPGLGGFLGQPSVGQGAGAGQAKSSNGSSLDNGYRGYDTSKLGGAGVPQQRPGSGAAGQTPQQTPAHAHQQGGQPGQAQQLGGQQQQPQQQYYQQQYNAYAGHQPNAAGGYNNYYRQYWAQ